MQIQWTTWWGFEIKPKHVVVVLCSNTSTLTHSLTLRPSHPHKPSDPHTHTHPHTASVSCSSFGIVIFCKNLRWCLVTQHKIVKLQRKWLFITQDNLFHQRCEKVLINKEKCVAEVNIVTSDIYKYSEKIVKTTKKKLIFRQILNNSWASVA